MTTDTEKSVTELRKRCKAIGVGMSIRSNSLGGFVTFRVGGIAHSSVISLEHYVAHESTYKALTALREEFAGVKYQGAKLLGVELSRGTAWRSLIGQFTKRIV